MQERVIDYLRAYPSATGVMIADALCVHWWERLFARPAVYAALAQLQRDGKVRAYWAWADGKRPVKRFIVAGGASW